MIHWVNVYKSVDGIVTLGYPYLTHAEAITAARSVKPTKRIKTIAFDDHEGEMNERERYEVLSRALDSCATPEGHKSGSYAKIFDALVNMCPTVYAEEARKMQAGWY